MGLGVYSAGAPLSLVGALRSALRGIIATLLLASLRLPACGAQSWSSAGFGGLVPATP